MANISPPTNRASKWVRWTARGIGSIAAAFWLIIALLYAFVDPQPLTQESMVMVGLMAVSLSSVLVAWWREGLGGMLLLICAIAQSVFAYIASGHHRGLAMSISGGPFLLAGILFLISWRRSRSRVRGIAQ